MHLAQLRRRTKHLPSGSTGPRELLMTANIAFDAASFATSARGQLELPGQITQLARHVVNVNFDLERSSSMSRSFTVLACSCSSVKHVLDSDKGEFVFVICQLPTHVCLNGGNQGLESELEFGKVLTCQLVWIEPITAQQVIRVRLCSGQEQEQMYDGAPDHFGWKDFRKARSKEDSVIPPEFAGNCVASMAVLVNFHDETTVCPHKVDIQEGCLGQ
eukprot:645724-Rhodomonas_salina.2